MKQTTNENFDIVLKILSELIFCLLNLFSSIISSEDTHFNMFFIVNNSIYYVYFKFHAQIDYHYNYESIFEGIGANCKPSYLD